MINMQHLFFELLRTSLGKQNQLSEVPTTENWEKLYTLAVHHALLGVCFYGIQRLPKEQTKFLPAPLRMRWLAMAAKIQSQNELLNWRCVELQQKVSEAGFCSYIMKGQGNAALYDGGLCSLRQSGDIDIYLDGGYRKVMDYVNHTYPTREVNELEVHYSCFNDAAVEIHYKPFIYDSPKDRILQSFFREFAEANFVNMITISKAEGKISVPVSEFNLVHQLVHIHHHLFYEGIGLRQLMDYYYVLKDANRKKADMVKVKSAVASLGLNRFAAALMWVLGETFGLDEEKMLWTPNERDGAFLLQEIMRSGNFGISDKKQQGIYNNKWKSFWFIHLKTFRFWRFEHWAWFWSPIYRIKGFVWRKMNGYN